MRADAAKRGTRFAPSVVIEISIAIATALEKLRAAPFSPVPANWYLGFLGDQTTYRVSQKCCRQFHFSPTLHTR